MSKRIVAIRYGGYKYTWASMKRLFKTKPVIARRIMRVGEKVHDAPLEGSSQPITEQSYFFMGGSRVRDRIVP